MDFEDRPLQPQGQHVAKAADITLATADDMTFDFEDAGYDLDLGPSDGIGSQDFDIDLGLSFGDKDETMSVEQGRDAMEERRFSLDSNVVGKHDKEDDLDAMSTMSRQMSEHPFAPDVDMFGGDLGGDIDLGLPFDDTLEKTPVKVQSKSRACEEFLLFLFDYLIIIQHRL
jgi:cohesin complex subunit SCC1